MQPPVVCALVKSEAESDAGWIVSVASSGAWPLVLGEPPPLANRACPRPAMLFLLREVSEVQVAGWAFAMKRRILILGVS